MLNRDWIAARIPHQGSMCLLDGVRRARFKPPTENGQPTAGWARIPIPFELEK